MISPLAIFNLVVTSVFLGWLIVQKLKGKSKS